MSCHTATASRRNHAPGGLGLSQGLFALAGLRAGRGRLIYWLLAVSPEWWWLWIGVAALFVSVILANLAPVLLLPLFYKLTPLPEGEVRAKHWRWRRWPGRACVASIR